MPTTIRVEPTFQMIYPTLVLGYETTIETRNVTHEVLGTGAVDVTLRSPAPRSGTLRLLFSTQASATAALTAHSGVNTFNVSDTDRPFIGMLYVPNGPVRLTLDNETRKVWTLDVPYQEVLS